MNARTIRKLLMRVRTGTFFGRRALLTVRFPKSVLPVARPAFTPPGKSTGMEGYWESEEGDSKVLYNISLLHSSKSPHRKRKPSKLRHGLVPTIHFPKCDVREPFEDGSIDERWTWWEGLKVTTSPDGTRVFENIPDDVVQDYVAFRTWHSQYLNRSWNEGPVPDTGLPWLDALHAVAGYAKRFESISYTNDIAFAYFLRLREPRGRLRFCAALSRAIKLAKKQGVEVYVMPPPRKR